MRRPLFMMCLCLILMIALGTQLSSHPREAAENKVSFREEKTGNEVSTWEEAENKVPFREEKTENRVSSQEETIYVTGRVTQKAPQSFVLKISAVSSQQKNPIFKYNQILCEYPKKDTYSLQIGDTLTVSGIYSAFSQATNPGEFDTREFYATQKICGKLKGVRILDRKEVIWNWREFLYHMQRKWQKRLYSVFPEKEASVLTAMLLGDKTNLDAGIKDLYKRNGIIHILSISGLHITLIGMGIYKLFRKFGLPVWLSALLGGWILLFYGVMTGMGVSTVRAILMYLIHMLAIVIGRTYDMLTALAVSGVILALWSPDNLKYAGFLFSFSAVLGIGILLPVLTPEERYVPKTMETNLFKKVVKKQITKWWTNLRQSFLAGMAIGLFTLPVQLWFYFEIPVYSIFLNLLILPLMGIVMVSGLFVMLIPGTGVFGTGTYLILNAYEIVCICFDKLPFHTWNPGRPTLIQVILYYVCLFLVVMGRRKDFAQFRKLCSRLHECVHGEGKMFCSRPHKRVHGGGKVFCSRFHKRVHEEGKVFCSRFHKSVVEGKKIAYSKLFTLGVKRNVLTLMGFIIAILILTGRFSSTDRVTFLDVGQGDGIVLELKSGEVFLIDCGSSSRTHVGQRVLIPYLKYRGISHVDGVFISHPDKDHCNGVLELLDNEEEITIGQVILPAIDEQQRNEFQEVFQAAKRNPAGMEEFTYASNSGKNFPKVDENIPFKYIKAGDTFSIGQMRVLCLHPPEDYTSEDSNSYSQCLYVEIGKASFLFTGDVEGKGEQLLVEELKKQGIETVSVLKAAHHGSKYSTSVEFLDTLHPQIAVLSAGKKNSYGHPHKETLDRLKEHDVGIYRTDRAGAISVKVVGDKLQIKMFVK